MPLIDLPKDAQLDGAAPPPGGTLVDLPQGAKLDAMPMTGVMRYPAMAGSALVKGALQSAGAIGDLDNFLYRQFNQGVFDPLHRLVTGRPATAALAASDAGTSPLSSTNLVAGGRATGAVDNPALAPQTTGEKYLTSTAEGVGGVLPYLPLGGANPASLFRGVTQGAAAGAGGEAGAQAFPEHPDIARAVAGLGGMALGGKAFDLGNRSLGFASGATSPVVDAYRNLGIDRTLAGDVSGRPVAQMLQTFAGRSPGGANRVGAASERAVNQWGAALDETAANYGAAATTQEAGAALQRESRAWLQQWNQAQQTAEQAVAARVPATALVDITPVNQVLRATTTNMPGLPNVAEIHTNPVFRELRAALAQDAPTGTATWADMRAWRTRVGEELQQSLLSGDGNQAAWRQLYGSLSRSLGDTAFANNAHNEWTAANAVTSQGHQFVDNVVSKFINARNPAANTITGEAAASAALGGARQGGSTLQAIRQEMPGAADELAGLKLRQMGAAVPGAQNAAGTQVSPNTFVTQITPRNLSPEARDALFGADPDLARRVQDLATVGESLRNTSRFLNTSNTGTHAATAQTVAGILGAPLGAYHGYKEGGFPGAVAGGLSGGVLPFLPGYAAGRLTTSPTLTGLLAAPARAPATSGLFGAAGSYPEIRRFLLGQP